VPLIHTDATMFSWARYRSAVEDDLAVAKRETGP